MSTTTSHTSPSCAFAPVETRTGPGPALPARVDCTTTTGHPEPVDGVPTSRVHLEVGVLVAAGVLHALGEVVQVAAAWSPAFEPAPEHAHGQYQGLFSTSTSAGLMAGSAVVALPAVDGGLAGRLALGGVFPVSSAALPLVVRDTDR
ncbi:MFS transporter [Saccharothrix syringae]|uniref:Uncharacterized protein n=1 Tax=Saccharothrix syringae TaxID=103733 RepID=A0A5Q0H5U6_SACSY|nr:hypothetical protein [Saccharothrix syringae]QFZ21275.1 hypothetical protein EKG83_31280 [Saccharothrix syringae]